MSKKRKTPSKEEVEDEERDENGVLDWKKNITSPTKLREELRHRGVDGVAVLTEEQVEAYARNKALKGPVGFSSGNLNKCRFHELTISFSQ